MLTSSAPAPCCPCTPQLANRIVSYRTLPLPIPRAQPPPSYSSSLRPPDSRRLSPSGLAYPAASPPKSRLRTTIFATSKSEAVPHDAEGTTSLNISGPVLITPLSSRSTYVVLHFPSSPSTCATTCASTVLFGSIPPSSFPTLVSLRACAPRCVASLKSRPRTRIVASSESNAVPTMQKGTPQSHLSAGNPRPAGYTTALGRDGDGSPWRGLWQWGAVYGD
ncbi:hypothetical protein FIBSPDRAFT_969866 [Athelia psychrophila]|uniref:Uncharacterized protein n=1 Tax=Athelia psychrophila TaxID=1759441 RepID=A0A167T464_9AGAM|nr:hypothetical protein FIBSPDRAFT_969866 [Fibularhizoctonia sp. CBS 109695]